MRALTQCAAFPDLAQEAVPIMWPKIPEDLTTLSAAELNALAADIRRAMAEAGKQMSAEVAAEVVTYGAHLAQVKQLATAKALSDAAEAEQAQEAADAAAAEQAAADAATAAAAAAAAADDDKADETADDKELAVAGKTVRTTFGPSGAPVAPPAKDSILPYLNAFDGVEGKAAGDQFESWGELAMALVTRAGNIRSNTAESFKVAQIRGKYDKSRQLGDNLVMNAAKFEPDEIQAAFCAPRPRTTGSRASTRPAGRCSTRCRSSRTPSGCRCRSCRRRP